MNKEFEIEGQKHNFSCNALMPRLYRAKFGSDLMADLKRFGDDYKNDPASVNYEVLENMAWLMLKLGSGEEVAMQTPEDWLATLENPTAIYELAPSLMELWASSQKTTAIPKKK